MSSASRRTSVEHLFSGWAKTVRSPAVTLPSPRALRDGHLVWRPAGALLVAPGFSWLAERVYSWVADHRYALPGGTPACRVEDPQP